MIESQVEHCNAAARTDLAEIFRTPAPHLTKREISILRALCVADSKSCKEIAFDLGITHGTFKIYTSRIYQKLGWSLGSQRMLVLVALAYREVLGIELPRPDQFAWPVQKAA